MDPERAVKLGPAATTALMSPGSRSPDRNQALSRTKRRRFPRFSTRWMFEIACATISIGAIIAIAAVLKEYDRQPLARWNLQVSVSGQPVQISLNSVISVLGTLAKSTMAVVLSSALCQSKWNWFMEQPRPLQDFEVFDSASHGPLGGVKLLWRTRARRIASLGAFLVVLNLVFDPFLQLLITYRDGNVDLSNAQDVALARSDQYSGGALKKTGHLNPAKDGSSWPNTYVTVDNNMARAINNALWNVDTRLSPHYSCTTGNCTWPPHVSLAVCSSCYDVTSKITTKSQNDDAVIKYSFPSSISTIDLTYSRSGDATNDRPGMNISGTYGPRYTFNFNKSQTLLYSLLAIHVDNDYLDADKNLSWSSSAVRGTECGLMLCANTYTSTLAKGNFSEFITDTLSERVPTSWSVKNDSDTKYPYVLNGTKWNPLGPGTYVYAERNDFEVALTPSQLKLSKDVQGASSFRIPQFSVHSLVHILKEMLVGVPLNQLPSEFTGVHENAGTVQYDSPTAQALWAGGSINAAFDRLATDLSTVIRSGGNTTLKGTASDIIVTIRWHFLTVPLLICVLGLLFLVVVIIQTSMVRMPVWKDSALAGLIWGLDDESKELARDAWRIGGVKAKQVIKVRYQGDHKKGKLVKMS